MEIGNLTISKETGVAAKVVFDAILEDYVGGATLLQARLPEGQTQVLGGAMLNIADGQANVIKTATVVDGGTATAPRVNPQHLFVVGDHIMIDGSSTAQTITAITKGTDYDTIAIATTMGTTPVADSLITEASTQGATPVAKYVANAILKETVNTERANSNCSGVVRGSVRSASLPYGAYADDIAALNLIRFV